MKTAELMSLLKTGNSDAARKFISKLKRTGEREIAVVLKAESRVPSVKASWQLSVNI